MNSPLTFPATDEELAEQFKVSVRDWRDQLKALQQENPAAELYVFLGRKRRDFHQHYVNIRVALSFDTYIRAGALADGEQ